MNTFTDVPLQLNLGFRSWNFVITNVGFHQENFVFTDDGFVFTVVGFHLTPGLTKTFCTPFFPLLELPCLFILACNLWCEEVGLLRSTKQILNSMCTLFYATLLLFCLEIRSEQPLTLSVVQIQLWPVLQKNLYTVIL